MSQIRRFAWSIIAFTFLPLHLSGQAKQSSSAHPTPSPQQHEIVELKSQIADLQKKVETLEGSINLLYFFLKDKQDRRDSIVLDFTDANFQRLDTDNGFLLVSAEQATPYLNGYKILLKIGNPLSMAYSGFKAKVKWSKPYDSKEYSKASYDEWEKAMQEKDVSLTDVLERGTWNKVELVLAPATAEQMGYVTLSISTDTVRMYQK